MNEYENLFAKNLQAKLKTKIVGKIFVEVNRNDELYVQIINTDGTKYMDHLRHFSDRLLHGWSTDYAAYEILREYKKFVFKTMEARYFYND